MTLIEIEALGQFLKIYHSDLKFIDEFSKFMSGKITIEEYHFDENKFSFRSFLKQYKVIRNIENGRTLKMLELLKTWNFDMEQEDLVKAIRPICHEKQSRSLVSKIYFLNNPAKYYPMDALVLNALKLKTNDYSTYYLVSHFEPKYLPSLMSNRILKK